MEIKAYNKMYLEDSEENLGYMLEYAYRLNLSPIKVWNKFIVSSLARQIENGSPKYIAGYSGIDYLITILNIDINGYVEEKEDSDRYFWTGQALARLQYETNMSFLRIEQYVPIESVLNLYDTLHESDMSKFIDIAISKIKSEKTETNLKMIRKAIGLTQKELSIKSGVDLRSIQMYEQKRNDINKAQAETLLKLSKALGCSIESLLE